MVPTRLKSIDPGILDREHLRRYTLGNARLEAELLSLFQRQLPALLEQIRNETTVSGDWKLAVHTLKGSAMALGAVVVADLALRLEAAGHPAPVETRNHLVHLLERAIAAYLPEAPKLRP